MNKHIRFLIVDDFEAAVDILSMVIEGNMGLHPEYSYTIDKYYSILQFINERTEPYDICVIDWNLPDGRGSEIVDILNKNKDNVSKAIYSSSVSILSGMTDDSQTICDYAVMNNAMYIAKGSTDYNISNFIKDSIERSVRIIK